MSRGRWRGNGDERSRLYSPILCAWREALDAKRLLWALFTCARPPPMSAAAAAGGPAALLRGSLELEEGWWSNGQVGVDKIGSAGGGREEEVGGGLGLPSPGRFFILFYGNLVGL